MEGASVAGALPDAKRIVDGWILFNGLRRPRGFSPTLLWLPHPLSLNYSVYKVQGLHTPKTPLNGHG